MQGRNIFTFLELEMQNGHIFSYLGDKDTEWADTYVFCHEVLVDV